MDTIELHLSFNNLQTGLPFRSPHEQFTPQAFQVANRKSRWELEYKAEETIVTSGGESVDEFSAAAHLECRSEFSR